MSAKKFKGTVLLGTEADSLEEAKDLSADESFLKSLVEINGINVTKIKCTGVEETDPGFYDLTCTVEGTADNGVDLKVLGIVE